MMLRVSLLATAALTTLLTAGPGARADTMPPLSDAQAKSLGHVIRLWSGGLVAGDLADPPGFTVTPADGHYDISILVAGKLGTEGAAIDGKPITAKATPGTGESWHLDDVTLPSPLRVTLPPDKGAKPVSVEQTYGDQVSNVVIDPTLASNSTSDTLHGHWRVVVQDGKNPFEMTARTSNTHMEWAPSSAGHVDSGMVTKLEDVETHVRDSANKDVAVTVGSVTTTLQSADADPNAATALVRRVITFVGGLPNGPGAQKLTPEQRTQLKSMLHDARNLSREGKQSIEVEHVKLVSDGKSGTIDKISLSQHEGAPAGKLDLMERLEVGGFHLLDAAAPAEVRPLLPTHIVFAPHLTGVSEDAVFDAIDQAIDDADKKGKPMPEQLAKLGGTSAIDELSFDLGPSAVSAHGQVTGQSLDAFEASASVTLTGYDALLKTAQSEPMLKQGVPVLIFLKGIGNQDGDKMVWDLAYKGGTFTVNGTDMSQMIPGK